MTKAREMDFTFNRYVILLETLRQQGFSFIPFCDYLTTQAESGIILRHDVDRLPENSLRFAEIEWERGIKGSYFFRIVPESFNERIIGRIADLGHEIGYHYEDFTIAASGNRQRDDIEKKLAEKAILHFERNLQKMRNLAEVKTICMHGSPLSRWDSRQLWKYYNYQDFGIVGEPYFDLNCDRFLYLTDTGRRWDGDKVVIRDKAQVLPQNNTPNTKFREWKVKPKRGSLMRMTTEGVELQTQNKYKSTLCIIEALITDFFPKAAMMTFHPQRWSATILPWVWELLWQNVKNGGKYLLNKNL